MNISEHFSLEEFCFSETASRLGLDNTPTLRAVTNLKSVAQAMESVRTLLGNRPILVHSGYRSPVVNLAVGGAEMSAHCAGLACDFVCPGFGTPTDVALMISRSHVEYDQLILEYGWVHLAVAAQGRAPRREVLTKYSPAASFEEGIRA